MTNISEKISREDRLCPRKRRDTDSRDEDCKLINEKRSKTETLIIRRETIRGRETGENRDTEIRKGDCEPGRRKETIMLRHLQFRRQTVSQEEEKTKRASAKDRL
jgi:hypothetical protein